MTFQQRDFLWSDFSSFYSIYPRVFPMVTLPISEINTAVLYQVIMARCISGIGRLAITFSVLRLLYNLGHLTVKLVSLPWHLIRAVVVSSHVKLTRLWRFTRKMIQQWVFVDFGQRQGCRQDPANVTGWKWAYHQLFLCYIPAEKFLTPTLFAKFESH